MIDIATLRRLIRHDQDTGKLYWLHRPGEQRWNSRWAGKEAFTAKTAGYLSGAIFNKLHYAHRVIWALHYGEWPDKIDHINGDKTDNRLVNLRSVRQIENTRNRCLGSNNTTGAFGVRYDTSRRKWRAEITENGRFRFIGRYPSFEEALAARKAAERRLGFHENHGRAA